MKPSKSFINKKNGAYLFYGDIASLPILAWGQSCVFFEYPGKVALIPEAGSYGNIDYRIVRIGKEPLTLFNADHIQIFFKRGTGGLLK